MITIITFLSNGINITAWVSPHRRQRNSHKVKKIRHKFLSLTSFKLMIFCLEIIVLSNIYFLIYHIHLSLYIECKVNYSKVIIEKENFKFELNKRNQRICVYSQCWKIAVWFVLLFTQQLLFKNKKLFSHQNGLVNLRGVTYLSKTTVNPI